jgi:hypothetical protein
MAEGQNQEDKVVYACFSNITKKSGGEISPDSRRRASYGWFFDGFEMSDEGMTTFKNNCQAAGIDFAIVELMPTTRFVASYEGDKT